MKVVSNITDLDTGKSVEFSKVNLSDVIQYEKEIKILICKKMNRSVEKVIIKRNS